MTRGPSKLAGRMHRTLTCAMLVAVTTVCIQQSQAAARFRHITMEDGLSANQAFTVIQDKRGYIWISTENGLDRYDGYTFRVFNHDTADPGSLAGSTVRALYEDPEGRLWVGTFTNGLDLYDPSTDSFKHFRHVAGDPNSIASDSIWALDSTPDGNLIIGTYNAGVDVLDLKTWKFRHYPAHTGPDSPQSNTVNCIFIDQKKHIWIGTTAGLDELNFGEKTPTRHLSISKGGESKSVWKIAEDSQHRLWLATQGGPYTLAPGDTALKHAVFKHGDYAALENDYLHSVTVDSGGNLWFGSVASGVFLVRAGSDYVEHYAQDSGNPDGLISNNVWDIVEDRSGFIWITTGQGINQADANILNIAFIRPASIAPSARNTANTITSIIDYQGDILLGAYGAIYKVPLGPARSETAQLFTAVDESSEGNVTAMQVDERGQLYAATQWGHLLAIDPNGKIQHDWRPLSELGIKGRAIHRILPHGDHVAYLATFGNGLLDYDFRSSKAMQLAGKSATELQPNDIVEDLLTTRLQKLWVATFRGLFQFDASTRHSNLVPLTPGNTEPVIQSLYEDGRGTLWIGTYDGLWRIKLDSQGNPSSKPEYVTELRRNQVLSIEHDDDGNLWLSTIKSLIKYDPRSREMMTFGRNQDSPIAEYLSYGHTRATDGSLWFGGDQGAIGFQPRTLTPNRRAPEVIITGGNAYRDGKPVALHLVPDTPVILNYQDAISTFDVAATDFTAPTANTYSYRLVGFQSQWTAPSTEHLITFTNLNPGRYRLEVRAANNWGTWSKTSANLELVVLPPWWRTWWAYTLYFLIIIGSSIGYVYSLKRKIEREKEVSASLREANEIKANFVEKLQTQVAAATRELRETLQGVNLKNAELEIAQKRATEGEQVKSQFLAHMSHELRTPLTGILGFTKLLGSTILNSEQKDYVGTIYQSSETLLAIINDTLDLSKLDAGKLLIDEVDFDLLEVIESTLELLAPTAYQKRLELVRVIPPDVPLQLRGDPLRLRQILTNLLSNAIKFTESGAVAIQVAVNSSEERETSLSITVSDTGIGISEIELPQLFHAYARSRISTRQHVEGTGLGLAICKKLLDLMGGTIQVKSRVGSGTSFEFKLKFKLQKNASPRAKLPKKLTILLYDKHPLSCLAWRASLTRLGAEVAEVSDLEMLMTMVADAAVLALSERELAHLGELKQQFSPTLPPLLILAPRIDRQALKDLSETLYHRVLSKSAREKTVYLELQSLVQAAIQTEAGDVAVKKPAKILPAANAPLILVADDNRINRRLLVTMLSHTGFRTAEAANGHELLDIAARGSWDAALLDIHMPGMDGIETATKLRAFYGERVPPIIAMSADVMPETRNQLQQGIMDDFLMKPFNEQQLVDMLRQHMDRHARRRQTTG